MKSLACGFLLLVALAQPGYANKGELMEEGSYSPKVGEAGKARLRVLNQIHNPYTLKVLEDLGIGRGMAVLDVGCGTGLVTCELAWLVGEEGTVVGIDSSEEQLAIARREADRQGLKNIEFVQLSAHQLEQLDRRFDLVYSRFLLAHLHDPELVIRKEIDLLQPGGVLFLEELAGVNCFASYPPSTAYQQWAEQVKKQPSLHHTDFDIGFKLAGMLEELGCTVEMAAMYQPLLRGREQKSYLTLSGVEIGPIYVEAGLMTQAELDELMRGLTDLEADDRYTLAGTRVAQVVARMPTR